MTPPSRSASPSSSRPCQRLPREPLGIAFCALGLLVSAAACSAGGDEDATLRPPMTNATTNERTNATGAGNMTSPGAGTSTGTTNTGASDPGRTNTVPTTGTPVGAAADGVSIDQPSAVMLARAQNQVIALSLACPHQRAAVKWLPAEHRFQCTKHDSKYQPTGVYTSGRATRNLDRYPIRRDGTSVVVDITKVFKSDQDAAGWAAAVVSA